MPKKPKQKLKLIMLLDILQRETDDEHPLTLAELQERLAAQGIPAERKCLYDDFEQLRLCGADILTTRDKTVRYFCGQRQFDLPELRLLVDAVQSSRFITPGKSRELIDKLETLTSRYHAGELKRQVVVSDRIKNMNESIYYSVDTLHAAIAADRQITFQYFDWDIHKKRSLRHGGAQYRVSPWALTWDNENYYLIAYNSLAGSIRHYRVDRMQHIGMLEDKREGAEVFEAHDMEQYTRSAFGMFGGEERNLTLFCNADMAGVILDRFGRDVTMIPHDDGFTVCVPVIVSEQFYGWLSGLGGKVRLTAPAAEVQSYRAYLQKLCSQYTEGLHDGVPV